MGVVIKQSIRGTIVNYVGVIIGFLTTFFILTAYLTQEEIGLTRVLVDAAVLFSSFAQLGTGSSIIRFFPFFKDEKQKHHGFFFWTLVVPFVGFLIFLLVARLLQTLSFKRFQKIPSCLSTTTDSFSRWHFSCYIRAFSRQMPMYWCALWCRNLCAKSVSEWDC